MLGVIFGSHKQLVYGYLHIQAPHRQATRGNLYLEDSMRFDFRQKINAILSTSVPGIRSGQGVRLLIKWCALLYCESTREQTLSLPFPHGAICCDQDVPCGMSKSRDEEPLLFVERTAGGAVVAPLHTRYTSRRVYTKCTGLHRPCLRQDAPPSEIGES